MKVNPISFADVLKRKEKGYQSTASRQILSLAAMLDQWEQSPEEDFTLYLGQSSFGRNRGSQQMIKSNNQSKGGMFDSWIERQALDNKQNTDQFGNRYSKGYKMENPHKKIVLNSKGTSVKTFADRTRMKNSIKSQRLPSEQVELITSNQYTEHIPKSNQLASHRNEDLSIEIEENVNVKSFKPQRMQSHIPNSSKRAIKMKDGKNIRKDESNYEEVTKVDSINHRAKLKVNQLQQLVNQTDHIHEEIAQLAHRFVLEEKKKSQNQEQELLLSLQGAKRLSSEEDKRQKNPRQKDTIIATQEASKNNLREQVKKQIGNFFKNTQLKNHLPTFGAKRSSTTEQKPLQQLQKQQRKQITISKNSKEFEVGEVSYSFATNVLPTLSEPAAKEPQYIPLLNIIEAPTIPLIQEIASERHNSQSNEQIENMYSKWRREENQHIDSEHVKAIESVNFYRVPDTEKQRVNSHEKQIRAITKVNYKGDYDLSPPQQKGQIPLDQSLDKAIKKRSAQKPQIIINIPIDYNEESQACRDVNNEREIEHVPQKGQENRSGVFNLSQSSKKSINMSVGRMSKNSEQRIQLFTQEHNNNKDISSSGRVKDEEKLSSLNSPSVHPSRDIYLSNHEEGEHQTEKSQDQDKVELNSQFKVEDNEPEEKQQIQDKIESIEDKFEHIPEKVQESLGRNKIIEKNSAPKQSPSQCFKNYGLNKVYSNTKSQVANPHSMVVPATTSEFVTVQLKPKIQQAISEHQRKPDSNHFSFGHNYHPINNMKKAELKEEKDVNSKKKTSGTKITLVASNKSRDKTIYKIESYAHTSAFMPGNIKPVPQEPSSQPVNNQEEGEEFNFDF